MSVLRSEYMNLEMIVEYTNNIVTLKISEFSESSSVDGETAKFL
jgi:hypothetical protein